MLKSVLDNTKLALDKHRQSEDNLVKLRSTYHQDINTATSELEKQIETLYERINHQNYQSEVTLLKCRAVRAQTIELKAFLKDIMDLLPNCYLPRAQFHSSRHIPTFQDADKWAHSTVPNSPKIPITKYTLAEPSDEFVETLWDDLNDTMDILERGSSIIKFYEAQIQQMQQIGLISKHTLFTEPLNENIKTICITPMSDSSTSEHANSITQQDDDV